MIEWIVMVFFASTGFCHWANLIYRFSSLNKLIKKYKPSSALPKEGEYWGIKEWPPFEDRIKVLVKNISSSQKISWIKYQLIDDRLNGLEINRVDSIDSFVFLFEKLEDAPLKPKLQLVKKEQS